MMARGAFSCSIRAKTPARSRPSSWRKIGGRSLSSFRTAAGDKPVVRRDASRAWSSPSVSLSRRTGPPNGDCAAKPRRSAWPPSRRLRARSASWRDHKYARRWKRCFANPCAVRSPCDRSSRSSVTGGRGRRRERAARRRGRRAIPCRRWHRRDTPTRLVPGRLARLRKQAERPAGASRLG